MSFIVIGGILAAAVGMLVSSAGLTMASAEIMTSSGLLPLLITAVISTLCIVILLQDLTARRRISRASGEPPVAGPPPETLIGGPAEFRRLGLWLLLSSGYALLTPVLGYETATAIALAIALFTFGKASWPVVLAVTAGVTLLLPMIFRHVFFTLVP